MFFRYRLVCFCPEFDTEPQMYSGIVIGSTYREVIDNLVQHYGEKEIEQIEFLTPFAPDAILQVPEGILDTIGEEIIW